MRAAERFEKRRGRLKIALDALFFINISVTLVCFSVENIKIKKKAPIVYSFLTLKESYR